MRVAGVSLRIEGAEQFEQGLAKANKAMSKNAQELKLLEATYGKKSTDSSYLTERANVLTRQLEEQRKKLTMMRQVREEYARTEGASADKLDRLDMEILKMSTSEAGLARQLSECNTELARQQQALDTSSIEAYTSELDEAGARAEDAAEKLDGVGTSMEGAGEKAAGAGQQFGKAADQIQKIQEAGARLERVGGIMTKALTLPIAGMGAAALKLNMEFDDAMYAVGTLPDVVSGNMDTLAQELDEYSEALLRASDRTHVVAKDLAAAQYDVISAGVSPDDSVYWTERAAMAAKVGRTDVSTVVSGASSMYNAWKKDSGGLDHILDAMMLAQNRGKTTIGELSAGVGQVSALAPKLGVSLDETLSAVAALTQGGLSTSSAFNGLKGVFSAIIKPTAEATAEAERLGIQFDAAAMQAKGLTAFLAEVQSATQGDTESLGKLFGSVAGLSSVMALGGAQAQTYAGILAQMGDSAGLLDKGFETRIASKSEQLAGAMNRLKNVGIDLAGNLSPAVETVTSLVGGVSDVVGSMDAGTQQALVSILGFTAALGPATTMTGKLMRNARALMVALSNPWVLGGAAVLGAGALLLKLTQTESAMERLNQTASELDLSIAPEDIPRITDAINRGIAAADKEHSVRVKATVDPDEVETSIQTAFDAAMADGRVSEQEYQVHMNLMVTVTEEAAEGTLSPDETMQKVAADLNAAIAEYQRLLTSLYRSGNTATQQELDDLEEALNRVKTLRAEMLGLQTEIDAAETNAVQESTQRVLEGYATEEDMGAALGYAHRKAELELEDIDAQRRAFDENYRQEISQSASQVEKNQKRDERDAQMKRFDRQEEGIRSREAQTLDELFAGYAQSTQENRQASDQLTRLGMLLDLLSATQSTLFQRESASPNDNALRETMTPEMLRALGFVHDTDSWETSGVDWLGLTFRQDENGREIVDYGETFRPKYFREMLSEAFNRELEGVNPTENPLMQYYQAMLNEGFDPASLDAGKLTGALAGVVRLSLFEQGGASSLGSEAMEAIGAGIAESAPEAESSAEEAASGIASSLGAIPDQKQAAMKAALSLATGLQAAEPLLISAAQGIAERVGAAMGVIVPAGVSVQNAGQPYAAQSAQSVGVTNNVNIARASFDSQSRVNSLSARIAAETRVVLRGMGG